MINNDIQKLAYNGHENMLSTKDVASLLGIHQNTVRRWSDLGLLRSVRISYRGDRRFRYEDITSFLDNVNKTDSRE